jgi:hypothetical protein
MKQRAEKRSVRQVAVKDVICGEPPAVAPHPPRTAQIRADGRTGSAPDELEVHVRAEPTMHLRMRVGRPRGKNGDIFVLSRKRIRELYRHTLGSSDPELANQVPNLHLGAV